LEGETAGGDCEEAVKGELEEGAVFGEVAEGAAGGVLADLFWGIAGGGGGEVGDGGGGVEVGAEVFVGEAALEVDFFGVEEEFFVETGD
jgi:hypothetical protein